MSTPTMLEIRQFISDQGGETGDVLGVKFKDLTSMVKGSVNVDPTVVLDANESVGENF